MGRRDDDARPPIEFISSEPSVASSQQVALGPRRPKPGRRRSLAIAVVVVAVLGLGLLLGGRDDGDAASSEEERDNQERIDLDKPLTSTTARRSSTTTRPTTTTTEPTGPPFGAPVDGALLIYAGTWSRVDLTTGAVTPFGLSIPDFYEAIAVAGGIALPSGGGEVWFVPAFGDTEDPGHVLLGPGERVFRAGPDRVWLIDGVPDGSPDPSPQVDVRLVDLDGTVLRSFSVPGSVSAATSEEVILSRGGRVYAADEDGIRPIATGWSVGTVGDTVLVVGCDDRGECALEQHPTDGGTAHGLATLDDPEQSSYEVVAAPDGRSMLVEYDSYSGGPVHLTLFDASGASRAAPDVDQGQNFGFPQLLPGDLGLLLSDGSQLHHMYEDGGAWVAERLPSYRRTGIEGALVVTP
jgi:hypothetical protein